jgi:uncharacterized protein involved in exopolysaccharide biosynthesis
MVNRVTENQRSDAGGAAVKPLGESLLDVVTILAEHRKFIVRFVLIATLLTAVITFLCPKWYRSTASVFPAEQTSLFPGLEGVSSLVKTLSGGGKKIGPLGGPSEADRFIAILKSDRVVSAMIAKFGLVNVYDYASSSYPMEKTAQELLDNTVVKVEDEGNMTVSVYDKDPARAAEMANYYVELLNQTNSELQVQNARGNREFIEQRYSKNLDDLKTAEEAMKGFQLKHGVVAVPEQTQASIKAGAELYARLAAKEIELNVLRRQFSEDHPGVAGAKIEIDEIRKKLDDMNSGTYKSADEVKILVPFRQVPGLATEYVRLYRDLQIQNKILEFITPLYEQAKIEEKRNTPSVVILDKAGIPERKAKPKILMFTLLGFVISLVVAVAGVFLVEAVRRLDAAFAGRVTGLWLLLRSDWFGLRSGGKGRG